MISAAHGPCTGRGLLNDASDLYNLLVSTIKSYTEEVEEDVERSISVIQYAADVVPVDAETTTTVEVTYASKKCPAGHYCLEGTEYPTRCGPGLYTSERGSASSSECEACKAGYYCLKDDNVAQRCPRGHYCPEGA